MTVDPRLKSGETVQWQGQSDPRAHLTRADSFFIPFSIVWLGFAVFWTVSVSSSPNAPAFVWLFGLVFVTTGLYMTVGRFFVKAAMKRRTQYANTGLDFFAVPGPGLPLAFYDVSDVVGLRVALIRRAASRSA